jgi:hypothetical protein
MGAACDFIEGGNKVRIELFMLRDRMILLHTSALLTLVLTTHLGILLYLSDIAGSTTLASALLELRKFLSVRLLSPINHPMSKVLSLMHV